MKLAGADLFAMALKKWRTDGVPQIAAGLTYYVMLSLAPLLVLMVGVLGRYLDRPTVTEQLFHQASAIAGPIGEEILQELIASTAPTAAGTAATVVAMAIALWGSMRVFRQLRIAFDRMWDLPPDEHPGGTLWAQVRWSLSAIGKSNLVAFLMVLAVGALIVASLIFSTMVAILSPRISVMLQIGTTTIRVLETLFSMGLLTALFALIYRVLPRTSIAWKDVWIGALMTAALFLVGRLLLGVYFSYASPGSAYGAAGTVVALLIWTNWSLQLVLFGAEFTHAWTYLHGSRSETGAG